MSLFRLLKYKTNVTARYSALIKNWKLQRVGRLKIEEQSILEIKTLFLKAYGNLSTH